MRRVRDKHNKISVYKLYDEKESISVSRNSLKHVKLVIKSYHFSKNQEKNKKGKLEKNQ